MIELFEEMYNGSWYTIIGAGGEISEWIDEYNKRFADLEIGKIERYEVFSGADMNEEYNLTGNNAYPDDLTFLAFPLDGLNIGKLAMFKLNMGDGWFDDIVNNNKEREEQKYA